MFDSLSIYLHTAEGLGCEAQNLAEFQFINREEFYAEIFLLMENILPSVESFLFRREGGLAAFLKNGNFEILVRAGMTTKTTNINSKARAK
jgi:hypothetical protein